MLRRCPGGREPPELRGIVRLLRSAAIALFASVLAVAATTACSRSEESAPHGDVTELAVERVAAWSYPAPVSGRISEANAGDFALVDGIAYPARDPRKGTVVFVASKAIASPILAESACPATQARALKLLRDASYAEVTLDANGRSETFLYGSSYGGQGRAFATGRGWPGEIQTSSGRAVGSAKHPDYGAFEFDLPIARALASEASEDDRMAAGYAAWGGDAPVPTQEDAIAAYGLARRAVLDGNLRAYLALQGFDAEQVKQIRGLAGIEDDFRAHGARFLEPGAPEEPMLANGFAAVGARGTNAKGEAFANYYEFTPCGGKLVLTSIALNPQ